MNPVAPALDVTALGIQITKTGDNDSPFLSEDGKKVVYISRKRPSHKQGQVYLFDLERLKERRITYQDGDCKDPVLTKDGQQVLYASSTDELKERPLLFQKNVSPTSLPPTEIYSSDLAGSQIQRLTQREGFDGAPWPRYDRPESFLYSIWNGKLFEVWQMNLQSHQQVKMLDRKDRSIESLRISPDNKRSAWIERLPNGESQIVVGPIKYQNGPERTLKLPVGEFKELNWLNDHQLVINAKLFNKKFQFYRFDLISDCIQNLFETNTDLYSPRPNSDGQGLVFVSVLNEKSDIFYKSLTTSDQCLKWEAKPVN